MVDKNYCMSSYLAFRYIVDDLVDFSEKIIHRHYNLIPDNERIFVYNVADIDKEIKKQIENNNDKKIGILLSGGMDSACLASYLKSGTDAYTFRCENRDFYSEEINRAEYYATKYNLNLHYVDISWDLVDSNIDKIMKHKGAPVHSIEPQIYVASKQAKKDGIELMIIGDAADYVFGGMDGLHKKDWILEEFIDRYIYVKPEYVLRNPVNLNYYFEKYRVGNKIDFINFMHKYTDTESYASYENAFSTCDMPYLDPYEVLKMSEPLDLYRIRNGESKYLIRDLFKMKYPEIPIPEKIPMPRPVDEYFKEWKGPARPEFLDNLDVSQFTGNQKWQIWCLERFLNMIES